MERVMISIPMSKKTEKEIRTRINAIKEKLEKMGYEVVDSYNPNFTQLYKLKNKEYKINHSLQSLGHSLAIMSTCDLVFFAKGWRDARGCQIEHEAAKRYGLKIMYEPELNSLAYDMLTKMTLDVTPFY